MFKSVNVHLMSMVSLTSLMLYLESKFDMLMLVSWKVGSLIMLLSWLGLIKHLLFSRKSFGKKGKNKKNKKL